MTAVRYAHLIESDGPGGAERMLASVAGDLQAQGSQTVVIAPARGEGWLARELSGTGVRLELFQLDRPFSPKFARWLADVFRRHRITLAHSHEFTMAVYGAWAARRAGIPHLITMHGSRYYAGRLQRRIAMRLAVECSAATVAVSGSLSRHLARDLWLRPARVVTIPNGVRAPIAASPSTLRGELGLESADQLVVAVGNLYSVKGHSVLLEALALLAPRFPRLHVAIAGRGELELPLQRRAAELALSDRFHLLGLRSDVANVLSGADVFVLSSLSEGVPLALLEAMLTARPVVASAVGEVPAVLDGGRAGALVPPSDPPALAAALEDLLATPGRAQVLSAAAYARASAAYTFDVMMDAYRAVYAQALRNQPDDARADDIGEAQRQPLPEGRAPGKRALVR